MTLGEVAAFEGPATRSPHVERLHGAEFVAARLSVLELYDRIQLDRDYLLATDHRDTALPFRHHPGYVASIDGSSLLQAHARPVLKLEYTDNHIDFALDGTLNALASHPERV